MRTTLRNFWLALLLTAAGGLLIAYAAQETLLGTPKAKPPFPRPGHEFVDSYTRGPTSHYLYRFGILGFASEIRKADILLIGTSHVELGLSAAELSENLSLTSHRRIGVFNLGLEFGEGITYAGDIIERSQAKDKILIVDLYNGMGDRITPYAAKARATDILGAYIAVGTDWSDFLRDWMLDGIVPRFMVNAEGVDFQSRKGETILTFGRALGQVTYRDWATGDLTELWFPQRGEIYRTSSAELSHQFQPQKSDMPEGDFSADFATAFPSSLIAERHLRVVFTLMPFPKYDPQWAFSQATKSGYAFAAIPPDGLDFLDNDHVDALGRTIATRRLAQKLGMIRGLVD